MKKKVIYWFCFFPNDFLFLIYIFRVHLLYLLVFTVWVWEFPTLCQKSWSHRFIERRKNVSKPPRVQTGLGIKIGISGSRALHNWEEEEEEEE